jgi:hypothetical protein
LALNAPLSILVENDNWNWSTDDRQCQNGFDRSALPELHAVENDLLEHHRKFSAAGPAFR